MRSSASWTWASRTIRKLLLAGLPWVFLMIASLAPVRVVHLAIYAASCALLALIAQDKRFLGLSFPAVGLAVLLLIQQWRASGIPVGLKRAAGVAIVLLSVAAVAREVRALKDRFREVSVMRHGQPLQRQNFTYQLERRDTFLTDFIGQSAYYLRVDYTDSASHAHWFEADFSAADAMVKNTPIEVKVDTANVGRGSANWPVMGWGFFWWVRSVLLIFLWILIGRAGIGLFRAARDQQNEERFRTAKA